MPSLRWQSWGPSPVPSKLPVQFSVTRIDKDYFHVVVQDEREIVRSYKMHKARIHDHLKDELKHLKPLGKSGI